MIVQKLFFSLINIIIIILKQTKIIKRGICFAYGLDI